jgi:hypothetical protein
MSRRLTQYVGSDQALQSCHWSRDHVVGYQSTSLKRKKASATVLLRERLRLEETKFK